MDRYIVKEDNKKVNKDLIPKTAALHNLGCKVNFYETQKMRNLLEQDGYTIVGFDEPADVYVVNTCSVTHVADKKSRQMLRRAKRLNPNAIVVAAGCFVDGISEDEKASLPVDVFLTNEQKRDIIDHISSFAAAGEHTRAFVKIQDGCNQFCSYCIIPYVRGRVKSRSVSDIIDETVNLAKDGYKEIVLTGIHVSSFGIDFDQKTSLIKLCERLQEVDGIERIRLSSLEPRIVTSEFASRMSGLSKLCPHFHLSLQSGCDETIRRMNRHYTTADFAESVRLLRESFDDPAITTDVITGFPGEDDNEFERSISFVRDIGFADMHVFKYSKRKGTKAFDMAHQVDENIKNIRSDRMIDAAEEMKRRYIERHIGSEGEVLFEERVSIAGKDCFAGFTKEYIRVCTESDENLSGIIKNVKLRSVYGDMVLSE